ncbi:unnamed protein product [Paramecium sonneborni]|uniref:Uncharacterized protein n=1 Tax=Paramecium sonneborni TaxID=65129 RepID=A0A8S1R618_9CILI|nr:unnamed protein product [Paramecium sonneborni]
MREIISNLENKIKSENGEFERWQTEFLINLNCLQQESVELGEFYITEKSEQNLIKIIQVLDKFNDKVLIFHQTWLQIYELRERLFRQNEQKIVNYSNYLINYLKDDISKLCDIKKIEQLGYKLAQQLLHFSEKQFDFLFKSEFLDMAYELQKYFTQNDEKYIIQPIIQYLDDFLIQEKIQLSFLTLFLEGFGLVKIKIFDQEFYCFHIHKAEFIINNMKEMQKGFDETFTKYQIQFLTKQKQNFEHKLSMKKISQRQLNKQINIFLDQNRQEQKLSVFIQNYGQRCTQDLLELEKNSNKFLDLQGLKLHKSSEQITEMIKNYQMLFYKMQQTNLCNLGQVITQETDEIVQLGDDKNQELKKRIDQLMQSIDKGLINAQSLKIKQDETVMIEKQLMMALDKLYIIKIKKKGYHNQVIIHQNKNNKYNQYQFQIHQNLKQIIVNRLDKVQQKVQL